ncbi:SDR family oxidoreductase [Candidatus Woesearchaeota archaeon]|nr:SDR family oxidoreductase [Candidatus Woesearchaeota archaeon]
MKGKKVIVTGGAGFIGSHLVDRLLELENQVIVIDDFSLGKEENLSHQKDNPNLKIHNKNICDKDIVELFKGVNTVFHVAAIPRVQYSIKNPEQTNKANINGTLNILEACRKAGVKRFVYSASSSAYGDQETLPLTETMTPNPMSPYALQKLVGEYYCKLYYLMHKIETISLRYFNVYGPRQDPSGGYACLIPKSINLVLEGKSPVIYGDGEQTRDFTFVKDVVESNILAAITENQEAFGQVFNIGNNKNLSVNFVVKSIIGDKDIKAEYTDPVIEPRDTLADMSKTKTILNWQPKYSFEQGIKETIEWFKAQKNLE